MFRKSPRRSDIKPSGHMPVLDELPVAEARGEIKLIYSAIEAAVAVKLVNLVYRHLATIPGALEWAWATVGPAFENGVFARRSHDLASFADIPLRDGISLGRAGLSEEDGRSALETIGAYNRANPMNALSLGVIAMALETGRPAVWRPPAATNTTELPSLLPMAPLDGLSRETMETLHRLARLTTGENRGLVPSLFRHFTVWPDLLTALAEWLEPLAEDGLIEKHVATVSERADRIAKDIFARLDPPGHGAMLPDAMTRGTLLTTLEIFPPAICRMIVIGGLLQTALRP